MSWLTYPGYNRFGIIQCWKFTVTSLEYISFKPLLITHSVDEYPSTLKEETIYFKLMYIPILSYNSGGNIKNMPVSLESNSIMSSDALLQIKFESQKNTRETECYLNYWTKFTSKLTK